VNKLAFSSSFASPREIQSSQRGGIFFRLLFLIFFIGALFLFYLARSPLLRTAGNFWIVDDPPAASDAIVILGDDDYQGDRATRAAELFKAGWAPRVIASGRYLRPYAGISELEEHDLMDRGVPKGVIVRLEHHAENTRDEAIAISQFIASHGWKRIIVVTSNYHTRRAQYICERVFPPGTVLRVAAARDAEYDPGDWWLSRAGLKLFTHEFAGMILSMWELRRNNVQTTGSSWFHLPFEGSTHLWGSPVLTVYS